MSFNLKPKIRNKLGGFLIFCIHFAQYSAGCKVRLGVYLIFYFLFLGAYLMYSKNRMMTNWYILKGIIK